MRLLRRLQAAVAPSRDPVVQPSAELDALNQRLRRLARRIETLEKRDVSGRLDSVEREIQELRGLGIRVADLVDLVAELIVHEASHRDPAYQQIVDKYLDGV